MKSKTIASHHFKFERRFVPDVEANRKRCTIRADRKRDKISPAKPGDRATFSHWAGRAYASKSVRIGHSVLKNVLPISIEKWDGRAEGIMIKVDGCELIGNEARQLAIDDGFESLQAMADFFMKRLPFTGRFYEWEPLTREIL